MQKEHDGLQYIVAFDIWARAMNGNLVTCCKSLEILEFKFKRQSAIRYYGFFSLYLIGFELGIDLFMHLLL